MRNRLAHAVGRARRPARRRQPGGFTLVELLVVIGIIALLVSILLPTLSRARQSAQTVACQSNMRQFGQMIMFYANQFDGRLPIGFWDGSPPGDPSFVDAEATNWTLLLRSMVTEEGGTNFQDNFDDVNARINELFLCPSADKPAPEDVAVQHFSSHPRLMPNIDSLDRFGGLAPGKYLKPYKIAQIKRSSDQALIFEGTLFNNAGAAFAAGNTEVWTAAATADQIDFRSVTQDNGRGGLYLVGAWSKAGLPSYMTPTSPTTLIATSAPAGSPEQFFNQDVAENWESIRFRHGGDTSTNVLHADGHVAGYAQRGPEDHELDRGLVYVNVE